MISVNESSLAASSTTKPRGTSVDGRRAWVIALIPFVKPMPAGAQISSKVSQSQISTPIDNQAVRRRRPKGPLMYTLVETAKMNDVDPEAWLADVISGIADHIV